MAALRLVEQGSSDSDDGHDELTTREPPTQEQRPPTAATVAKASTPSVEFPIKRRTSTIKDENEEDDIEVPAEGADYSKLSAFRKFSEHKNVFQLGSTKKSVRVAVEVSAATTDDEANVEHIGDVDATPQQPTNDATTEMADDEKIATEDQIIIVDAVTEALGKRARISLTSKQIWRG